jgi:hypothetical protein
MSSCNGPFEKPSSSHVEDVSRRSTSTRPRDQIGQIYVQTEEESVQAEDRYVSPATKCNDYPDCTTAKGESEAVRIERLGRMRPDQFKSVYAEVGFAFSICMSQVLSVCILQSDVLTLLTESAFRNTLYLASMSFFQHSQRISKSLRSHRYGWLVLSLSSSPPFCWGLVV